MSLGALGNWVFYITFTYIFLYFTIAYNPKMIKILMDNENSH